MDGRQGAAGSRGAQAEVTSARPDGQALGRAPDHSSLVIESGLGQSAAVAAEQTARLEAYPFALRPAEAVDGQIAIDEEIFAEVQRGANAVARVRRNRHALIRGRRLALDQWVVHAKPGGARAIEELSFRDPILHQVAVAERCACEGHTDDRTLVSGFRALGDGCRGVPSGIGRSSSRCIRAVNRVISLPWAVNRPE